MNQTQALSDAEIDELDDFLLSDDTPENSMDLPALDGFFAALVLNPGIIMPSEYLPWIWDMEDGCEAPAFASMEQAAHIIQLLMRYYNSVLDAIIRDDFAPLFYMLEQTDDSVLFDAESWCEGFMRGVFLFSEPWLGIFEKHPDFLSPMVLLGTEHGWEMLDKIADVKLATQDAYESIADTVALLYGYFGEQRDAQIHKVQPGRDSPEAQVEAMPASSFNAGVDCPCDSGKKFKKCCGAPRTVH